MALKASEFSVQAEGTNFIVFREDKALETPLHFPLAVPTRDLAEAIVKEFAAQGAKTNLRQMPMTQMALTALDVSSAHHKEVLGRIMRYGETELICQRAEAPKELVVQQSKTWQPYLDWCKKRFDADLQTGVGIVPFKQKEKSLAALYAPIEKLDVYFLTGLGEACSALGSLVLGLALMEGQTDAKSALEAAELESLWQAKKWGEDPVSQKRQEGIRRDIDVCAQWFAHLKKQG